MFAVNLAFLAFIAGPAQCEPAAAPKLSAAEAKPVIESIERDRKDDREWLKKDPSSYLAAVRRKDFGSKSALTIGGAADNDVRLDDPGVRPHHVKVTVKGDKFLIESQDSEAFFSVGNSTDAPRVRESTVDPTAIRVGRFLLRLSHQGYPAIIVFDPKSPRFAEYHGIDYFPIDLSYRYVVKLIPDSSGQKLTIHSTHSADRTATRVGWFEFLVGNTPCRLAVSRLNEPGVGKDDLSVFFRDATTGKETYSVGRYVEPKTQPDGTYVLDFNTAYSPACAFSKHYNCPIPPKENFLKAAIRAGERDSHYH